MGPTENHAQSRTPSRARMHKHTTALAPTRKMEGGREQGRDLPLGRNARETVDVLVARLASREMAHLI